MRAQICADLVQQRCNSKDVHRCALRCARTQRSGEMCTNAKAICPMSVNMAGILLCLLLHSECGRPANGCYLVTMCLCCKRLHCDISSCVVRSSCILSPCACAHHCLCRGGCLPATMDGNLDSSNRSGKAKKGE